RRAGHGRPGLLRGGGVDAQAVDRRAGRRRRRLGALGGLRGAADVAVHLAHRQPARAAGPGRGARRGGGHDVGGGVAHRPTDAHADGLAPDRGHGRRRVSRAVMVVRVADRDPRRRRRRRRRMDLGRHIVKLALLYFFFLKAMVTTFGGTASLAVLREDLVVRHAMLTDRDLNLAVTAGRSGPGPNGIYLVSVGY